MELTTPDSMIKKVEAMATQEGMENGFELLEKQMKPFKEHLEDTFPLVESVKYREIPAEFPGVQVKANTPLTPEASDEYEQLDVETQLSIGSLLSLATWTINRL